MKVRFTGEVRWAGCEIEDEIVEFPDGTSNTEIGEAWIDWFIERVGGGGFEVIDNE